jgi:hypothetical protein
MNKIISKVKNKSQWHSYLSNFIKMFYNLKQINEERIFETFSFEK